MDSPLALIVDNDKRRRAMLGRTLKRIDLDSRYVPTLTEAHNCINQDRYQLMVFRLNGEPRKAYSFCRHVCRENPLLTSVALLPQIDVTVESRLFDCGVAEVAAAKQTTPSILLKRIINHLRPNLDRLAEQNWIRICRTWVNFDRHEVWCNGQSRQLPGNLAELLRYFLEHPNHTISRQELFESHIWQQTVDRPDRGKAIDMAVSKLRKIIEPDPQHPQIILSVRGHGFKLAPDI